MKNTTRKMGLRVLWQAQSSSVWHAQPNYPTERASAVRLTRSKLASFNRPSYNRTPLIIRYIPRIAPKKKELHQKNSEGLYRFLLPPLGREEFSKETINHKREKRGFFGGKKREPEAISVSNGRIGDSF